MARIREGIQIVQHRCPNAYSNAAGSRPRQWRGRRASDATASARNQIKPVRSSVLLPDPRIVRMTDIRICYDRNVDRSFGIRRLIAALLDPRRCERMAILVLAGYVRAMDDVRDIGKEWPGHSLRHGRKSSFGRERSASRLSQTSSARRRGSAAAWFACSHATDWAYYLLAIALFAALALDRLAARRAYLDDGEAAVALLAADAGAILQFPRTEVQRQHRADADVGRAATWTFLRSFEPGMRIGPRSAGLAAAAAMLGKYWSVFLLPGWAWPRSCDQRRWPIFAQPAPWITIAVGAWSQSPPHVAWLIANDFPPFDLCDRGTSCDRRSPRLVERRRAIFREVRPTSRCRLLLAFAALAADRRCHLVDTLWPREPDSAGSCCGIVVLPLLLPVLAAARRCFRSPPLWTMPHGRCCQ